MLGPPVRRDVMGTLDGGACGVEARALGKEVASRGVVVMAPRTLGARVVETETAGRGANGSSAPKEKALTFVRSK